MSPDPLLSPDDPRLTAYALGELDEAERAVVEAAVQADPALQESIAEIRALAGDLATTLATEEVPAARPGTGPRMAPAKVARFPYFLVSGLAAAAFAVLVAVRDEPADDDGYITHRYEVDLRESPDLGVPVAARGPGAGPVYPNLDDNPFRDAGLEARSAFPVGVGTASYAELRRSLQAGRRPPRDAVRIEELVNYFPYDYPAPENGAPVGVHVEAAAAPWAPGHRLVRIGLVAAPASVRAPANLVFLLDVSGGDADRLPLVREALRRLLTQLDPQDRVAIVTSATDPQVVLPSTPIRDRRAILAALDTLDAGGPTSGPAGLPLAYAVAEAHHLPDGINRIILCTDGTSLAGGSTTDVTALVAAQAAAGVALTALDFGPGHHYADTLERLAWRGRGTYGRIDPLAVTGERLAAHIEGALPVVAQQVEVEVAFDPARVQSYRLVGYENPRSDAGGGARGELRAGQAVTALYEVVPVPDRPGAARPTAEDTASKLLTVKLQYRPAGGAERRQIDVALHDEGTTYEEASTDFRFSAAVAGFGLVLRDSIHRGAATLPDVLAWAQDSRGDDEAGFREDFVRVVRQAMNVRGG